MERMSLDSFPAGIECLTRNRMAGSDRVAGVVRQTRARRRVLDDRTFSVTTARSGTRILAFIVHARFSDVAVGIGNAFRSTTLSLIHI